MNLATPPRVVHIVPALFDRRDGIVGGAERYALELARHMADRVPTALVSFGDRERQERIGNLSVTVIGRPWHVRGQRTNPFALSLVRHVAAADVIHCHQQHVLATSVAALAGRALGRAVFCTDLGGGGWDISAYASTDRVFHGHLHISQYSRTVFGHGDTPRARVIFGGVDAAMFSPVGPLAVEGPVLFVGRLLPHKGIDVLLRALPERRTAEIIGTPMDARYRVEIEKLAARRTVTFHHEADDRQLVDAYRRASCVVLPSVYRDMYGNETAVPELLGQTLLEGMASGLPAVTTTVASLPEVVVDGITGIVVPPNDPTRLREALEWLATNPDRARTMGRAGRDRVLNLFQWSTVVDRCLEAYGEARGGRLAATIQRSAAL